MGLLILLLAVLLLPSPAWATFEQPKWPLHGFDVTTDDSAGSDQYSLGLATELRFGSEKDVFNQTGSLRAAYGEQWIHATPSDYSTALVRTINWTGGMTLSLDSDTSIGVDLDSSSDNVDGLFTNGVKLEGAWKALSLSYRLAKTEIQQGFRLARPNGAANFKGAFVFQNQVTAGLTLSLGSSDGLLLSGSYSVFTPDADGFANLLSQGVFSSLSPLQSAIQSFEVWDGRVVWKHYFPHRFDSTMDVRYAHLVFPINPHWDVALAAGKDLSRRFHLELGTGYSHDSSSHQLTGRAALRFSWENE